jgi:hypothetical protein
MRQPPFLHCKLMFVFCKQGPRLGDTGLRQALFSSRSAFLSFASSLDLSFFEGPLAKGAC